MADDTARHQDAREVIYTSLRAASGNHDSHIKNLARKLDTATGWAEDIMKEHDGDIEGWERNLTRLAGIPASEPVMGLIRKSFHQRKGGGEIKAEMGAGDRDGSGLAASVAGDEVTLRAFIGFDDVRAAATAAKTLSSRLGQMITDLSSSVDSIISDHNSLLDSLEHSVQRNESRSQEEESEEPSKLLEEMQILIKKISSDFEHVATLPEAPKSASQVSKLALLHSRNYLPSLLQYAREMSDLQRISVEQRNQAQAQAIQKHMPTISSIESRLSGVTYELDNLSVPPDAADALDTLSLVSRLPQIYGSVLIEIVRRQEWTDKLRSDTSMLAEELAGYRSEEDRRRRKWLKSMRDVVTVEYFERSSRAPGVEVNLQNDDSILASGGENQVSRFRVARADLYAYVNMLARIRGLDVAAGQLGETIRDLDRPTKQQAKHVKAFKMGSVYETGLGRKSALMLRGGRGDADGGYGGTEGDDEMKTLKSTNAKLEDELKSQKSRVRKLEDLLHRQSQLSNNIGTGSGSRPPSGAFTAPQGPLSALQTNLPAASPSSALPQSATEAVPAGRASSPAAVIGRPSHELSRKSSVSSRRYSSNAVANPPTDERVFTARILKLEAELHEERERRTTLEREASESASANEATLGELQRQIAEANSTKKDIMENMEAQQKEFADERRMLEEELGRHKMRLEELEDEVEGMMGSRHGGDVHESRVRELESEVARVREEADEVMAREKSDRRELLVHIYDMLYLDDVSARGDKEGLVDDDAAETADGLVKLIQEQAEALRRRMTELIEDKKMWEAKNQSHVSELAGKEVEISSLNEAIRYHEGKSNTQAASLDEERGASAALRDQLAAAESRSRRLTSQLKDSQSHVNSLDVELSSLQTRYERLQGKVDGSSSREKKNIKRVRDLVDRLGWQGERLLALVEGLGFVVLYGENGELSVQRASKVAGLDKSATIGAGAGTAATKQGKSANLNSSVVSLRGSTDLLGRDGQQRRLGAADGVNGISDTMTGTDRDTNVESNDIGETGNDNDNNDEDDDDAKYATFLGTLPLNPNDPAHLNTLCEAITKRTRDIEHTARKWQKEARAYRDRSYRLHTDAHYNKIAFRGFREGDLALFLPTRNHHQMAAVARTKQNAAMTTPWAAFNSGAPHYFLRERDGHRLAGREYLVGRIVRIEDRIVDLSGAGHAEQLAKMKPLDTNRNKHADKGGNKDVSASLPHPGLGSMSDADLVRDEFYASPNPFDLSDGLRWFLVDAVEEKPGAPSTPGLGKSTVASAHVDAKGTSSITRRAKNLSFGSSGGTSSGNGNAGGGGGISIGGIIGSGIGGIVSNAVGGGGIGEASRTLNKSLESRRSSSGSKVGSVGGHSNAGSGSNAGGNRSGNEGGTGVVAGTDPEAAQGGGSAGVEHARPNSLLGSVAVAGSTAMTAPSSHRPPSTSHLSITRNADEDDDESGGGGGGEDGVAVHGQSSKSEEEAQQQDAMRRTQLPGP